MPLILGTNSIKDTGYDVANSVRLQDAYLKRTVTPSTSNTWTLSFWLKLSGHNGTSEGYLFSYGSDGGQGFYIRSNGYLGYYGGSGYGSDSTLSQGVLRDSSAWYHICFSVNSGTGTLYINGVQDATISNVAPLNATTGNTYAVNSYINYEANFDNFLGYMAEYVFIDGTAYNQNSFGEFDSDSPNIWKPIDVSGLTFGTNGFYLDFEDSSNLGNDVSGNNNDFTTTGLAAADQSTDTCTNNFATFNNLLGSNRQGSQLTFSEGNCKVQDSGGSNDPYIPSTIGVTKGKWYAELKLDAYTEDGHAFGIAATDGDFSESTANLFCILQYATKAGDNLPRIYNFGDVSVDDQADNNPGDIIGCAVDIDNGTVDFTVNGSAYASQVTGLSSNFSGKTIFFIIRGEGGGSRTFTSSINFGSPSFSISSGNSDANGHGNFEYSVPSGYFALCTKNLAENG